MSEVTKRLLHRIEHIETHMKEGQRVLLIQSKEEFEEVKKSLKWYQDFEECMTDGIAEDVAVMSDRKYDTGLLEEYGTSLLESVKKDA